MTRTVHEWLAAYGDSHRHPVNKLIHLVCVPLIVVSIAGLLWSAPVPAAVAGRSDLLNWAVLLLALATVYYAFLSVSLALGMAVASAGLVAGLHGLQAWAGPVWPWCSGVFVLAWIGQFVGHHIEGRRPSFLKDVQFLLIGPLWLLAAAYRRLGVPY